MPLKITKATDAIEVKNLTACIYAVPGVGKTTLGFTADAPILLDFDKGSYRAGNRGDVVQIATWDDVTSISRDDLTAYKTVVVDTAGRALDCLTAAIIAENPKMGRGGALTLQGFGELKARFISWTKLIRGFGLDVVLISHSDEQRNGDEVIERLDMQGSSKNEIYKAADIMGRIYFHAGKRILNLSPTETAFGKNPSQLPPLEVPSFVQQPNFLGMVIRQVKDELNKQSAQQKEVTGIMTDWSAKIDKLETVDDFNQMLTGPDKPDDRARENVKRLLAKAAKAKGYMFDAKAGAFVMKQKAAA